MPKTADAHGYPSSDFPKFKSPDLSRGAFIFLPKRDPRSFCLRDDNNISKIWEFSFDLVYDGDKLLADGISYSLERLLSSGFEIVVQ